MIVPSFLIQTKFFDARLKRQKRRAKIWRPSAKREALTASLYCMIGRYPKVRADACFYCEITLFVYLLAHLIAKGHQAIAQMDVSTATDS
jgi:hypothetical protein